MDLSYCLGFFNFSLNYSLYYFFFIIIKYPGIYLTRSYETSINKTIMLKGHSEVAQSCPTLCDPMDCSLPGSSIHGILQARILEWIAISFSKAFIISCSLGLLITDLSVSAYLGKSLFLFYFWRIVLLDVKFLNYSLFLSALWIYVIPLHFGLHSFW